jgi:hypothetical protein
MRIATRLLALTSILMGLGSTLLNMPSFNGIAYNFTYWEIYQRWDIITLSLSVMLGLAAVIALANPGRLWDLLVAVALTFVFTNYAPAAVEYRSDASAALILGGVAAAVALFAGLLLLIEGADAPRTPIHNPAAYPTAAHAGATFVPQPPPAPVAAAVPRPARVPQSPAAGWYPDPGGSRGQRYWDGAAWTNDLRS